MVVLFTEALLRARRIANTACITPFNRRDNSPRELVTLRRSHIYREQGPWIPEPVPQRPPSPLCQWLLGADRGEPSSTGFAGSPRGAHSCSEALTAQLHSDLDQGHLSGDEKGAAGTRGPQGLRLKAGSGEGTKGTAVMLAGGSSVGMEEAWSFWRDGQPPRALNPVLNLPASLSSSGGRG